MSDRMSPEEAQAWLDHFEAARITLDRLLGDSLRTIASMSPEYRSDIVDPFTNGGAYEVRTMIRHVTQWEET